MTLGLPTSSPSPDPKLPPAPDGMGLVDKATPPLTNMTLAEAYAQGYISQDTYEQCKESEAVSIFTEAMVKEAQAQARASKEDGEERAEENSRINRDETKRSDTNTRITKEDAARNRSIIAEHRSEINEK